MFKRFLAVGAIVAIAAGCGSKNPNGPDDSEKSGGNTGGTGGNTMTVNCTRSFAPNFVSGVISPPNGTTPELLIVSVSDAAFTNFAFATLSTEGTHNLSTTTGMNALFSVVTGATASWSAIGTRGSGQVVVNSKSSTGASGTFDLTMEPITGSTTNNRCTGSFTVKF